MCHGKVALGSWCAALEWNSKLCGYSYFDLNVLRKIISKKKQWNQSANYNIIMSRTSDSTTSEDHFYLYIKVFCFFLNNHNWLQNSIKFASCVPIIILQSLRKLNLITTIYSDKWNKIKNNCVLSVFGSFFLVPCLALVHFQHEQISSVSSPLFDAFCRDFWGFTPALLKASVSCCNPFAHFPNMAIHSVERSSDIY